MIASWRLLVAETRSNSSPKSHPHGKTRICCNGSLCSTCSERRPKNRLRQRPLLVTNNSAFLPRTRESDARPNSACPCGCPTSGFSCVRCGRHCRVALIDAENLEKTFERLTELHEKGVSKDRVAIRYSMRWADACRWRYIAADRGVCAGSWCGT